MNDDNLRELLDRYCGRIPVLYGDKHDELFKWKAVKTFRDVWFSPEAASEPFSVMFAAACRDSSVLINNSQVSPTNGIVKLAEAEPETVRRLFTDVLFAPDGGEIDRRQDNMESFLERIEAVRVKYYPQCWKYKQDRHAASCYLTFFAPEDNYIYRFSDADEFAKRIEYGVDIGSGANFRLSAYYKMCDRIAEAIKEDTQLMKAHFDSLRDCHYRDESMHILTFDLMYCSRTYNLYAGMEYLSKKESVKKHQETQRREDEDRKRGEMIAGLREDERALKIEMEKYEDISLLNVEVTQKQYGTGTVICQQGNLITVRFSDAEKSFYINRKYSARPTFDGDEEIVSAFTEYDLLKSRLRTVERQLAEAATGR